MKKTMKISTFVLMLMILCTFVSCAPKDADAAKTKLEKKGYVVVVDDTFTPAALKLLNVEGIKTSLIATKEGEVVTAVLFEKSSQAKASLKQIQKREHEENASSAKVSGKWVYYGTTQGMKDFA